MKRILILGLLVFASKSYAESEMGVGYQLSTFNGSIQSLLPALSARAWLNENVGIELNLYKFVDEESNTNSDSSRSVDKADTKLNELKFFYAPFINENSKYYFGLGLGNGSTSSEYRDYDSDNDLQYASSSETDHTITTLYFGTEHSIPDRPELKFSWELGHQSSEADANRGFASEKAEVSGFSLTFGGRYYF